MKTISIIIPVYNEQSTILTLIKRVQNASVSGLQKEIIVIDDCSTDDTGKFLSTITHNEIKIVKHPKNLGKGASLRTGFLNATGDIILIQDADLEYDPDEYELLLEPILNNKADVVYGSRFISSRPHRVLYYWHFAGNKFITLLSDVFTNLNLTDIETCFKVFKKDIIQKIHLKENRFGFEPEITAKIAKIKNIRIYEVGISYYGRSYEEGKKIGWKDGIRAIYCIIRYNLFK